jgi:nucleotide-binding universal stress UspA family protein
MNSSPTETEPQGVLCGTDFSPAAAKAADVACAFAKLLHAPVELTHVCALADAEWLEKKLSAEAERLRQRGFEVNESLLDRLTDEALTIRAKNQGHQLVVVASHRKSTVDRWISGSVSEKTAEYSTVPTMVVRDPAPLGAWARGERPLKIFIAYNHTPASEAALVWVKSIQVLRPCEVVVCYVASPAEQLDRVGFLESSEPSGKTAELQTLLERELRGRTAKVLGTTGIRLRVVFEWSCPEERLAAMAKEENSDLFVVGSHQYHGFERLWKSSKSAKLLRTAAMNVAVVPFSTAKVAVPGIAPPIRRVLVPTDFSEIANLALPHAYALLRSGDTLRLMTVAHPHELPGGKLEGGPLDREFEKRHTRHIAEIEARLRTLIPPEATVREILTEVEVAEHTNAGHGICQAAERFEADAICMATHGRSGLAGVIVGSVAQKVLSRSSRPLLFIRPPANSHA